MIRGFWQSRLAYWAVLALSGLIAVLIWVRDRSYPIFVPILASALMLAIGFLTARILGNLVSSHLNTRYLGLLHMELDPKAFLLAYGSVPGRLKPGSRNQVIASAYLADGYAAAGEFDRATAVLSPCSFGTDKALKGLYYNNLSAYALGKGDLEAARAAMGVLEETIEETRFTNTSLYQNLEGSLRLYRSWVGSLTGGTVEGEWLRDLTREAPYKLRRLEAARVLAQDAAGREDWAAARTYWKFLSQEGGKTYYKSWADRQENQRIR